MSAFKEITFPYYILSYTSESGPSFNTTVVRTKSGFEVRQLNSDQPLFRARGRIDPNREDLIEQLVSFFHIVRGRYYGFRWLDWNDYKALENEFATTTAGITTYQLYKKYTYGSETYLRKITKPYVQGQISLPHSQPSDAPDFQLWLDTTLLTLGTDYTVDHTTGLITLANDPGTGKVLKASYTFAIPVRFDNDTLSLVKQDYAVAAAPAFSVVEIRT